MKKIRFFSSLIFTLLLSACNITSPTIVPEPTAIPPTSLPTQIPPTFTPSPTPGSTALALSDSGSYYAGIRHMITYVDESRGGREVSTTIMYPAKGITAVLTPTPYTTYKDAALDLSSAPYPLIITTSKDSYIFGPHLATYGFIVVGINGLDTYRLWNAQMIQQPLDLLFILNKLADDPPDFLVGNVDITRTGVMGYSFDGLNSLFLSGARVYPDYLFNFCENIGKSTPEPPAWYSYYICNLELEWDEFAAIAGNKFTTSNDGLWKPLTDPRIIAVMPMAPDGAHLFGDLGLESADRPALMISSSEDEYIPKDLETDFIFDHLGSAEKTLITFMGYSHMMIEDAIPRAWLRHFLTAFFGYHLQGHKDYAFYYSPDYLAEYQQFTVR